MPSVTKPVTTERSCQECIHAETWVEYGESFSDCLLATSALQDREKYRKHWEWREECDDGEAAVVCRHYEMIQQPPSEQLHLPFPEEAI